MDDAVIGITFSKNKNEVLCIKRRDVVVWTLPGGGIDPNETPEGAVVREIEEETGLQVKIVEKSAEYSPINRLSKHTHVFLCEPISGEPTSSTETLSCGFFPIDQLPEPYFFLHEEWIRDALSDQAKPIRGPIHQISYPRFIYYILKHPIYMGRYILSRMGLPINS